MIHTGNNITPYNLPTHGSWKPERKLRKDHDQNGCDEDRDNHYACSPVDRDHADEKINDRNTDDDNPAIQIHGHDPLDDVVGNPAHGHEVPEDICPDHDQEDHG